MKEVLYTATKPLWMNKYWKKMDQAHWNTCRWIFKIKNRISPAIFFICFWLKREIISTLDKKMTFFYLLYKQYIIKVKANLTQIQKCGVTNPQNWTKNLLENVSKNLLIYESLYTQCTVPMITFILFLQDV